MTTEPHPTQPVSASAPGFSGPVIMKQRWQDLAFLHWRVDPDRLSPLMPDGVRPDIHDGSAWIGLIPFEMIGAGIGRGPAVPWWGTFAETNVRVYSIDSTGRRGVVFLSLEAERIAVVLGARAAFGIKYMWAKMRITRTADRITYTTTRRWPGPAGTASRITIAPGAPITEPDALAKFLTARWGLHTSWLGRTLYVPNNHQPWTLQQATLIEMDDHLLGAAGFPGLAGTAPDSVLYSTGVDTVFGLPRK